MAGYPCGHPAKNFGQALDPDPGKNKHLGNGHSARTSMKKLRSEKLRADFPFPNLIAPVAFVGVVFVPRGIAEWPARVDRVL